MQLSGHSLRKGRKCLLHQNSLLDQEQQQFPLNIDVWTWNTFKKGNFHFHSRRRSLRPLPSCLLVYKLIYFILTLPGVLFGGHVRLVFTLILFIYVICVSATITSFAELPLSVIEASRDEVLQYKPLIMVHCVQEGRTLCGLML